MGALFECISPHPKGRQELHALLLPFEQTTSPTMFPRANRDSGRQRRRLACQEIPKFIGQEQILPPRDQKNGRTQSGNAHTKIHRFAPGIVQVAVIDTVLRTVVPVVARSIMPVGRWRCVSLATALPPRRRVNNFYFLLSRKVLLHWVSALTQWRRCTCGHLRCAARMAEDWRPPGPPGRKPQ